MNKYIIQYSKNQIFMNNRFFVIIIIFSVIIKTIESKKKRELAKLKSPTLFVLIRDK